MTTAIASRSRWFRLSMFAMIYFVQGAGLAPEVGGAVIIEEETV